MRYVWDGKTWVPAEGSGVVYARGKAGWPRRSLAMGVLPANAKKATEIARRNGINVEHCPRTGDAIVPDARTDRKYQKFLGMFDKDAFS